MPQIGPAEILVVLLVGLLVFGPKRLPEVGRQVGRAMKQVKGFQESVMDEIKGVMNLHDSDPAGGDTTSGGNTTSTEPAAEHAPSRFRAPVSTASSEG